MANESERREQDPDSGWTGQMHDPTMQPGETGDAREAAVPGGAKQGGSRPSDEEGVMGSGLEGATASDDEPPYGAAPPA